MGTFLSHSLFLTGSSDIASRVCSEDSNMGIRKGRSPQASSLRVDTGGSREGSIRLDLRAEEKEADSTRQ